LVNEPVAELGNNILEDVDTNGDGEIQIIEAQEVIHLFISGFNINSLVGIEDFNNLVWLDCGGNNITTLDISENNILEKLFLEQIKFKVLILVLILI
jgi:hypothetical protein